MQVKLRKVLQEYVYLCPFIPKSVYSLDVKLLSNVVHLRS